MSGASFGVGFWLGGKPLRGYVLKAVYTNYSYIYKSTLDGMPLDEVSFVERRLMGQIGSYGRYGAFIIGGMFGLGAELNDKTRCIDTPPEDCEELEIDVGAAEPYLLTSSIHPIVLDFTLELGVAF
jgi:hypothetical protein